MKKCTRCKNTRPQSDFRVNQGWCRDCQNEYNREWYHRNRERGLKWRRNGHLVKKFGITSEEYDQMFEEQGNVCKICGAGKTTKHFAVDHDHNTGKIRGILCGDCNLGLGKFKDDPELLRIALQYLSSE